MDSFNPTTKTQAALTSALQAATTAGNPEIRPAHLLMALLTQNDGIAAPLLEAVGVDPATIRTEAQCLVDRLPSVSGANSTPQLSRESLAAITAAQQLATEMDDEYVSTEHLMVGLAGGSGRSAGSTPAGDSEVAKLLTDSGASPQALREAFVNVRGSARVTSADPEATYQALEKYSTDLTAAAREGKLDPVIGRDNEIRRVVQVLSRRTKNNPVL
ncbi:MAG: ATPase, partial [Mycobacterium sp.]|nr:ATPase [Mycobacterium sp.]